jgi:hypothetical protein
VVVLVTTVVFWLAHVSPSSSGRGVSQERTLIRADIAQALRDRWALVQVVIPVVLVLALGASGAIPDGTALAAATAIALIDLPPQAAMRRSGMGPARAGPSPRRRSRWRWGSWSCCSKVLAI